jgi:preprotein translocase subunit Sss1
MKKTFTVTLIALFTLSLTLVLIQTGKIQRSAQILKATVKPNENETIYSTTDSIPDLSPKDRLLLFGDQSKEDDSEQWKALHDSSPENPSFYRCYLLEIKDLPSNFDQIVATIAPDNGYFDVVAASRITANSFEKVASYRRKPENEKPLQQYEILDPVKLQEGIARIETAMMKPTFDDYSKSLSLQRIKVLPKPNDLLSSWRAQIILASQNQAFGDYRDSYDALAAYLQLIVSEKDQPAFLKLEKTFEQFSKKVTSNAHNLISILVARSIRTASFRQLKSAAAKLGMPKKEDYYKELSQRFILNPTEFSEVELLPTTRAEHALAARIQTSALFGIFSLLAFLAFIVRFRISKEARGEIPPPAGQHLLKSISIGLILPLTLFLILRHLTPLGVLSCGPSLTKGTHYIFPFIALSSLVASLPIGLARTLVREKKFRIRSFAAPLLCLLSMILIPMEILLPSAGPPSSTISLLLLAGVIIWLFVVGIHATPKNPEKDPDRYRISQLLSPTYLLAATIFGLLSYAYSIEESSWVEKSKDLESLSQGFPNYLEQAATIQAKRELEELLNP